MTFAVVNSVNSVRFSETSRTGHTDESYEETDEMEEKDDLAGSNRHTKFTGTKTFIFTVKLKGIGSNPEEAWLDATEAFDQDPGVAPKDHIIEEETDEMVDSLLKTGVWENPNSPLFKGEK
jgi:hypothetical protein